MSNPAVKLRIGIVGCGAVSEICHLPALLKSETCVASVLIDRNRARAEAMAKKFNVPVVTENIADAIGSMDAAIVALPHHLHADLSIELMNHGIHVLVEKPMAGTVAECDAMTAVAKEKGTVLAVGLMRRFKHAFRWTKAAIESGLLGKIQSFDIREGYVYNWPVASDFFFKKETAGGGVLLDTGAHTLDLMLWWFGDVSSFNYVDDDYGGVEAESLLECTTASGVTGVVELSRTRTLRNSAIIVGEKGRLEVSLIENRIVAEPASLLDTPFEGMPGHSLPVQEYLDLFPPQIENWVSAVAAKKDAMVPGAEAMRSVKLIDECYHHRQLLRLPWMPAATGS